MQGGVGDEERAVVSVRAMQPVALRVGVPGTVRADVREIDGRLVVWVEIDASERKGALSSASSSQLETAATLAGSKRLPLVAVVRSSGADIAEGFGALHGLSLIHI